MKETSTIPIVFAAAGDPVGVGLVQSLARPAGNVTGVSNFQIDYIRKLLEFLRTARPGLARVALLADPVGVRIYQRQLEEGARSLNLQLISAEVRAAEDLAEAFALMHRERADAVIVVGGGLQTLLADRIDELLLNYRLPAAYSNRYSLRRNGLIAYSQNPDESWRLSAGYVDRILKGAKPAEMPVVQPTRVELVINLRAAKALGLTIPQSLLLRADEVIE
jgi:putative ABC transport system substrate-binding protein